MRLQYTISTLVLCLIVLAPMRAEDGASKAQELLQVQWEKLTTTQLHKKLADTSYAVGSARLNGATLEAIPRLETIIQAIAKSVVQSEGLKSTEGTIAQALVIIDNLDYPSTAAAVEQSRKSLILAVSPTDTASILQAVQSIRNGKMQIPAEFDQLFVNWVKVNANPDVCLQIHLLNPLNTDVLHIIWDRLIRTPPQNWTPLDKKLSRQLPPISSSSRILFSLAIEELETAKPNSRSIQLPFTAKILTSQHDIGTAGTVADRERLFKIANLSARNDTGRLATWMLLNTPYDPAVWSEVSKLVATQWFDATESQPAQDGAAAGINMHDLLPISFLPDAVINSSCTDLHERAKAVVEKTKSNWISAPRDSTLRLCAWSLFWRTSTDIPKTTAMYALHPASRQPTDPTPIWSFGMTPYGEEFLKHTAIPSYISSPNPKIIEALEKMPLNDMKIERYVQTMNQFPNWPGGWDFAHHEWGNITTHHRKFIQIGILHQLKSAENSSRDTWLRTDVQPTIPSADIDTIPLSALLHALKGTTPNPFLEHMDTIPINASNPWDMTADALLICNPNNPRIRKIKEQIRSDTHPASAAIAWLFDCVSAKPSEPFPGSSWTTFLTHPRANDYIASLSLHADRIQEHSAMLRHPSLVMNCYKAGILEGASTRHLDSCLRLMGLLDSLDLRRTTGRFLKSSDP